MSTKKKSHKNEKRKNWERKEEYYQKWYKTHKRISKNKNTTIQTSYFSYRNENNNQSVGGGRISSKME